VIGVIDYVVMGIVMSSCPSLLIKSSDEHSDIINARHY
jgi:hypothetical protein